MFNKTFRKLTTAILVLLLLISIMSGCTTTKQPPQDNNQEVEAPNDNKSDDPANPPAGEQGTPPQPAPADPKPTEPAPSVPESGEFKVHYIDVGQGDAILITAPSGKTALIDAGDNAYGQTVVNYIKGQGISKLDVLIGTHPHADHIGGMDTVIDTFDIGQIYMPKKEHTTKTFEDVLNAIADKGLTVKSAKAGVVVDLGAGVDAKFVAPVKDNYGDDLNAWSAVLHLKYGETSFLFTGDAESHQESDILNAGQNIKANVLKVGHHGSNTSSTEKFIKAVDPQYAVIMVGEDNKYGHPTEETLVRLNELGIKIYRTDEVGTIIVTSDGKVIKIDKKASTVQERAPSPAPTPAPTQPAPTPTPTPAPTPTQPKPGPAPQPSVSLTVTASVDNPTPTQNSAINVIVDVKNNGQAVQGAKVTTVARYKSTNTPGEGTTGADGIAYIPYRIGRASKGFEVVIEVTVEYNGVTKTTSTSFTPQ